MRIVAETILAYKGLILLLYFGWSAVFYVALLFSCMDHGYNPFRVRQQLIIIRGALLWPAAVVGKTVQYMVYGV